MRTLAPALVLAAAALACNNKAGQIQAQIRDQCLGFTPGTTTLRDANQAFTGPISIGEAGLVAAGCATNRASTGGSDRCTYDGRMQVCIVRYEFLTTDCSGPVAGGTCAAYCDLRTDGTPPSPTSASAVICAREFIPNQPVLAAPSTGESP